MWRNIQDIRIWASEGEAENSGIIDSISIIKALSAGLIKCGNSVTNNRNSVTNNRNSVTNNRNR